MQVPLAPPEPATAFAVTVLPEPPSHDSDPVWVSSTPGSVNSAVTFTNVPLGCNARGLVGTFSVPSDGATLAMTAVVVLMSVPPLPSSTLSVTVYVPLSL